MGLLAVIVAAIIGAGALGLTREPTPVTGGNGEPVDLCVGCPDTYEIAFTEPLPSFIAQCVTDGCTTLIEPSTPPVAPPIPPPPPPPAVDLAGTIGVVFAESFGQPQTGIGSGNIWFTSVSYALNREGTISLEAAYINRFFERVVFTFGPTQVSSAGTIKISMGAASILPSTITSVDANVSVLMKDAAGNILAASAYTVTFVRA